jgi:septal ring factor EnvC (AmiA/AmiB activator)
MKLLVDDLNKNLERQLHYTHTNMNFLMDDYDSNNSSRTARERKMREDILLQDTHRDNAEQELHELEKTINTLEKLTSDVNNNINRQEKDLCRIQSLLDEPRINLEIDSNCKLVYSSPPTLNTQRDTHDHTISYAIICGIVSLLLFITMIFLKYFYKPSI